MLVALNMMTLAQQTAGIGSPAFLRLDLLGLAAVRRNLEIVGQAVR